MLMRVLLLLIVWSVSLSAADLGVAAYAQGLSPQDALKQMTALEGFSVKLVAAEPDLNQPVAFCFDERGRIWVLECPDYPRGKPVGQKGNDRILILEDADGDGKAEKRTVFYEGLNLATGLEVGYGGVFVGQAPHLLFIADRNRDDKPDGEPEIVLTGFGRQDTHELLNSFSWGPDGWLYGCNGVFTTSVVQDIKFTACIWRYHPGTKKFEIFAEGGSNQWGFDWDDWGQMFMTCCVIPHLYHVVPGGLYIRQAGQNANPYAYGAIDTIAEHRHYTGNQWSNTDRASSDKLGGGHAHCGAMVYLGDTFPPEFRNTLLMGNIHGNRINKDALSRKGSGYTGNFSPDFVFARDKWFRATAVKLGPDGSIFVSDWYDKQHCHHNDEKMWDRSNGRLYKVEYQGTKPALGIDLFKLSTPELVKLQSHRNDWMVRQSRRILTERKAIDAAPALKELALNGATQELKLRGLWALYDVGGFDEAFGLQLLDAKEPWVRVWAIRLMGEGGAASPAALSKFAELAAKDSAAEVRSQLASTCQRIKAGDTLPLLHALMLRSEDAKDQNIPLLVWIAYEQRLLADTERASTFLLGDGVKSPLTRDYILPRVIRRLTATAESKQLEACVAMLGRATTDLQRSVLTGMLDGLKGRGQVVAPANWAEVYGKLKDQAKGGDLALLRRFAAQMGDAAAVEQLLATVSNTADSAGARTEAMAALSALKAPAASPVLLGILRGTEGDELKRGAVRGLGAFGTTEITNEILASFKTMSPQLRVDALDVLCGRKESAVALLNQIGSGAVAQNQISESAVRRMRELKDPEVTKLIEKNWGRMRERTPDDVKAQIEKMKKVVTEGTGDLVAGAKIFERTCMQCHDLFGKGAHVGPELTGSARKDTNYLLQNIVDPNAMIGAAYYVWTVKLKDGRVVTGMIAEQNDKTVTLKRENNAQDVLSRADIASMKESPISLMPEGIHEGLKPQEFRDLVKFVQGDGWPK